MIVLPENLKLFVIFIITQGIKSLVGLFGGDVSGKWSAVTAVVIGAIVFFIEGILALVPDDKVEIVAGFLSFAGMIIGSFGAHYTYKNFLQPK